MSEQERHLPRGLWIGTAVFALLSVAALVLCMRMGRHAIETASAEKIEKAMRDSQVDIERRQTSSGADKAQPAAPGRGPAWAKRRSP